MARFRISAGRSLDRQVDGDAFRGRPGSASSGSSARARACVSRTSYVTTPVSRARADRLIDETSNARKAVEVRLDELLRGLRRYADILGQGKGGLAIEQRIIDDFARRRRSCASSPLSDPKTLCAVWSWMSSPR